VVKTRLLLFWCILDGLLVLILDLIASVFQPVAVVLPHHNLVQSQRQPVLRSLAQKRPKTNHIILIGPDHFSSSQRQIYYSDSNWHLSNGQLSFWPLPHLESILTQNNSILKNDHAIYNLLPDLKKHFPQAQVFPILVGQKVDFASLKPLLRQIETICRQDCLLIASVDFSHYLPATLAYVHDQTSIRTLHNLDLDQISNLEVDSPQSLYLLASFAQFRRANKFSLYNHTNSGFLTSNPEVETTTHIFATYSPSLLPQKRMDLTTFTYLPFSVSRSQNQTSVGDRFFYGVDNFQISSSLPLNLTLPPNFLASGFFDSRRTFITLIPFDHQQEKINFVRGPRRRQLVDQLLNSYQLSNLQKNPHWSIITYDP
jgi:AmmeMemoRadiSam system protein B